MFAIYIDPLVCSTWAGYFIPECWGLAVMQGLWLCAAIGSAVTLRTISARGRVQ